MGAARSVPPPADSAPVLRAKALPRRPALELVKPERYAAMIAARDILRGYVARRRISERELSECWQVNQRLVRDKLEGHAPIHLGEVLALPHRISLELLDEVRLVVLERVRTSNAHR